MITRKKKYIAILVSIIVIIMPFLYVVHIYKQSYDLLNTIKDYKPVLSTKIYDRNGILISELFEENRSYVEIDKIPSVIKKAFMAAEDQSFYRHTGIDFRGILRALIVDLFSGKMKQGGSTITQQLAKQLYTRRQKTLRRKVLELFIANELERRYTKDKILEMYLNQIYFGHGAYGIESASRYYFNKELKNLNAIEAAILAGIPSAPNHYSPVRNPRASYEKSKKVIHNMINEGIISKQEVVVRFYEYWKNYLPQLKTYYPTLGVRNKKNDRAPYFTEYIRRKLVEKYGEEMIYKGGLSIYTSLDINYQEIAQKVLNEALLKQQGIAVRYNSYKMAHLDWYIAKTRSSKFKEQKAVYNFLKTLRTTDIENILLCAELFAHKGIEEKICTYLDEFEKLNSSSRVEGAMVAIEPQTGLIVTMIGGSTFSSDNQLNRAVQAQRQPGSSFKAFVYGAGIESGKITAGTMFLDAPVIFKGGRREWNPSNYERTYLGKVLVRGAFAASLNIISALIYDRVGGSHIANFASRMMNIPMKRFEIDPTLALGTTEVTPLELTRGFAVFANHGREVIPISILSIVDKNGIKIYDSSKIIKRPKKQVISRETAFIMTSLMQSVVNNGTASSFVRNQVGFKRAAAGKTGTNTAWRDAWFAGFTPDLVATVWIGCDSQKFTLGPGQSGANVASPIWAHYMKEVHKGKKEKWFWGDSGRVYKQSICARTGKIPVAGCPRRLEYFISGTGPKEECDSNHKSIPSIMEITKKGREMLDKKSTQIQLFKDLDEDDNNQDRTEQKDVKKDDTTPKKTEENPTIIKPDQNERRPEDIRDENKQ